MTRDWPILMRLETLAAAIDQKPEYVRQLVHRGLLPQPVELGETEVWERDAILEWVRGGGEAGAGREVDPYSAGAAGARHKAPRSHVSQAG